MSVAGESDADPEADQLMADDNLRVCGFVSDEITYYQVKDVSGRVLVHFANAGHLFWAIPAGAVSARTSLPSWRLKTSPDAVPIVIYRNPHFSLVLYDDGKVPVWSVELPEQL